ncbi:hypothetical protein [Myceligenerans salitolerans]|uniref:XRE family transcriptional regulator n=1 Tax=Myceligenerans salitolerans TaxID=1230528 RepID=A0ABS3ICT3_9MICO|nr:hypothetical protein [Myceligenerans salitolerans]MBO0609857.1 hypothetical protein [Myceligenerans salitolerans]
MASRSYVRVAEALGRAELPRFLAAAIEVQTSADHPFGRDMALRKPSEADIRSVVPLADRVVQHVAAHAGISPKTAFKLLGQRWPHARWARDVQQAVGMCLLSGGPHPHLTDELVTGWLVTGPSRPWVLFVAEHTDDLLSVCRLEHERAWITRMLRSVGDIAAYEELIKEYTAEAAVLEARRQRARNGLVHGNPTNFPIVESVREYATFLSSGALRLGIESYVENSPPQTALKLRTPEVIAMQAGQDAVTYWRRRVAALQDSP